jgi:hypothetical protein
MKSQILTAAIAVLLTVKSFGHCNNDEKQPTQVLIELTQAIREINFYYAQILALKEDELLEVNRFLRSNSSLEAKINCIVRKDEIRTEILQIRQNNLNEVSKVRYLKGLQIIKILYEKVLSLDHHFASVRTFSEITKIANPNQYPEFDKLKEFLAKKREKKSAFELTSLLGTNTIASVIQTFTAMLSSSLTKQEKEKELIKVECVLDFTLRMQNDLNTIYFETAFLQTSNDKIKQEIEVLFKEYTKPIGYSATLENCRTNDDWEEITQKMEGYLTKMKAASGSTQHKMQVNLDFPIDRLLQFIAQYNYFIDQGGKFYQKFSIILNSYENQKQCDSKLALEYKKLKADINVAIEKFNVAYKPVEINGTKMKEILYGLNEF